MTGASQGIGAGMVDAFRGAGCAVIGTSRTIPASHEWDFLTAAGDITEHETAERAVDQTLERFGRIDDITDAILYLERATFATGETLRVDGGWAAAH